MDHTGKPEPADAPEEVPVVIKLDKMKNRRAMAWTSFILIQITIIPMLMLGLVSEEYAVRVDKLSFLLITLASINVSIVFAYFGVSHLTDMRSSR